MDDFKGVVKVDFKDAREKSGVSKEMASQIFKELSYSDISLDDVENGTQKINEEQINTLFGMYGIPAEYRKEYNEKYTNKKF